MPVVIAVLTNLKFLILVAILVIFIIIVRDEHCFRKSEEASTTGDKAAQGNLTGKVEVRRGKTH